MKNRTIAIATGFLLAITGASAAQADEKMQECSEKPLVKAGTFTASGKNVGLILGGTWGEGVLTLNNGGTHKFKFVGGTTLDLGYAETKFEGTVYNLDKIEDFPGVYAGIGGGLTAVTAEIGGSSLTNGACVVLNGHAESSEGLRIKSPIGPGGVEVSFIN